MNTNNELSVENRLSNLENAKSIIQCNIPMTINKQLGQLPYNFYNGSAVVYNNEIHILGSNNSGNYTKHYKYNGSSWTTNITTSILNKISIPKDMIIQCSSYDTSKTNSSTLQSLGSNKYKALSDTIVYTKEDKVNITNHQ